MEQKEDKHQFYLLYFLVIQVNKSFMILIFLPLISPREHF